MLSSVKKAERQRIDAFELWCWRRLFRVPWTARRSNQSFRKESVLNIHWKNWCWNWNCNTLATCCEELTHLIRPWCWKRLKAGGEGDDKGWDGWMASPTQWAWVWVNSGSWWWTGRLSVLQYMGSQRVGLIWATMWKKSKGFSTNEKQNYNMAQQFHSYVYIQKKPLTHSKRYKQPLIHCSIITIAKIWKPPKCSSTNKRTRGFCIQWKVTQP